MQTWQMQEAKARLSEVVRMANSSGPQDITMHGNSVAVMVSRADFDKLAEADESLVSFMRRSPLYGLDNVCIDRDRSVTRKVAL